MRDLSQLRVLDLFCGAGGAAMGLHQAGFGEIVGVDIKPQPRYPFKFVQADAMTFPLEGFDFIWASPPCQRFSALNNRFNRVPERHPNLIEATRHRLRGSKIPHVIENVMGAPLCDPVMLCGSMFKLEIEGRGWLRRHRIFEASFLIGRLQCRHPKGVRALGVYGHGVTGRKTGGIAIEADAARQILQVPWMTRDGAAQAIPPAYSKYIAEQFQKADLAQSPLDSGQTIV